MESMKKLREIVIKRAIAQQNQPLSSSQIDLIDRRLHHEFPHGLRILNHPTYAHMIQKAIKELNEEGGSTETKISKYIKEQFEDLPWAHKSILNFHLNKLCGNGELVFNASNRYSIPMFNEVQEYKMVNETSTEHEPASFLMENELIKVKADVDGTRNEYSTGLSEIALLEENPRQKDQETCQQRDVRKPEMNRDEALQEESLDETRTVVKVLDIKRKKDRDFDRVVDPIKPKQYNTRKKKNPKGNQTELVLASLDSPSTNALSLENDCQGAELAVASMKTGFSGVKESKKEAKKWMDGIIVSDEPSELSDPLVTKRYNTRNKKSKGKSVELILASIDSQCSNVLSSENDFQGTELVVVPEETKSLDAVKKKKESMKQIEPAKLPDPIELRRYNTRKKKNSIGSQTELIGASLDSSSSHVLSLENDCHGAELTVFPKKSGSSVIKGKKEEARKRADKVIEPRRYNTRKKSTELILAPFDSPSSMSHEHEIQPGTLTIYQEESKIIHSKESKWPSWVESLLQTHFFGECEAHPNTNKNICNFYCINCMNGALCASCLTDSHDDHRAIRVCRTKYEEAVNISEIKTYLDISGIQIHKKQGKSPGFVSLKRAVQTRFCGSNRGPCACNSRHIPHPFCFCSLNCKHKHQMDVGAPSMGE